MSTGQVIYVPLHDLAVTTDADQDIWEIAAPAGRKIALLGWELTSEETSPESVDLRLVQRSTTGNGGTAVEVTADPHGGSIAGVVETLATAPGTIGSIFQSWKWEQQGPVGMVYTPEMQIKVAANGFICMNLMSAVAATRQWSGWVCWEEV